MCAFGPPSRPSTVDETTQLQNPHGAEEHREQHGCEDGDQQDQPQGRSTRHLEERNVDPLGVLNHENNQRNDDERGCAEPDPG